MKKEIKKKKPPARKEKDRKEDWTEAGALLADIAEKPLTREEKGAAYVGAAEVYASVAVNILENYKKSLEETVAALRSLAETERRIDERAALIKTRISLSD